MKHIIQLLTAAAATMVIAAALISCDKNNPNAPNKSNPTEFTLPGHDFTVMVEDYERGFAKDSNYVFEGIFKDGEFRFGLDKLDPMTLNILPDKQNQIILKVNSDSPGFDGVNASSSSRCINIVADGKDHTTYHLEWVSEGESTITLWCGEGTTRKEISFKATSKKEIPMEGIAIRLDGELIETRGGSHVEMVRKFPKLQDDQGYVTEEFYNWDNHKVLEIVGPIPLNATLKEDEFFTLNRMGGINYQFPTMIWPASASGLNKDSKTSGYYENISNYPDFRWFDIYKLNEIIETTDDQIIKVIESYKLKPSDIRERRMKLWCIFTNLGKGAGTTVIRLNYAILNNSTDIYKDQIKNEKVGYTLIKSVQ